MNGSPADLAIHASGIVKVYPGRPPVEAVRGIDLSIQRSECFGVLGPNGAGKTTTIEILEGLLPATAGEVQIFGMNWSHDAFRIRQNIGVSLQETQLSERLTVRETLQLFRSFYDRGMSIDQVMNQVSLTEKAGSWVKKLSGGQKQRLAVACALVGDPDLLFLDEPTTGLDPASRRQMWEIIRDFGERNKTVMVTTHYMEEAERLCDRVAIFDHGKVIAQGTPHDLIASLGAEHVIEFTTEPSAQPHQDWQWLKELPSVEQIERDLDSIKMTVSQPHELLPALIENLSQRQQKMSSLVTRHASLEDVFVHLTGRQLIDES